MSLTSSIIKSDPKFPLESIQRLQHYVTQHNLTYIEDKTNSGCWFLARELSVAKGLAPSNYCDYIKRRSRKQRPIPGRDITLTGTSLANYKKKLLSLGIKPPLGSTLTIVDYKKALAYLDSSYKPSVKPVIKYQSEYHMQTDLILLASHSQLALQQEVSFDYATSCIRLDIYDRSNSIIYELKKHRITLEMVEAKLHYLKVLPNHQLTFVSPVGCTKEVTLLLKTLPNVNYIHLTDLTSLVWQNIRLNTPASANFYLRELHAKYQRILDVVVI